MIPSTADLAKLGDSLAKELGTNERDLVACAIEDLGFVRRDALEEVDTVRMLLEGLNRIEEWIGDRRPICGPGQEIALLLPYNVVAWPLWDIAALLAGGNRVRLRLSGRAKGTAILTQDIVDRVCGDLAVVDAVSREAFLDNVFGSESVPLLIAYGSEALGASLLAGARRYRQKVVFEGPGKDPMIVLEGSDIPRVVEVLRRSKFQFSGQQCTATETLLVHEALYEEVIDATRAMMTSLRLGDPSSLETDIGPIGSPRVAPTINRQLADAVAKGARLIVGGEVDGRWVSPTLVADVRPDMSLWAEETFGPVLGIASFRDERQIVELVQQSRFGLHCITCGSGAVELANRLQGAPYAEPVPDLRFGCYGTTTVERSLFSELDDYLNPFGGYGVSGWIWEGDRLRQGPRILAREATLP